MRTSSGAAGTWRRQPQPLACTSGLTTALRGTRQFPCVQWSSWHFSLCQRLAMHSRRYGAVVMLWVCPAEHLRVQDVSEFMDVDRTRGEKLRINFDITFPAMPCGVVHLDAMDVSGQHQNDVAHHVQKIRLDKSGELLCGIVVAASFGDPVCILLLVPPGRKFGGIEANQVCSYHVAVCGCCLALMCAVCLVSSSDKPSQRRTSCSRSLRMSRIAQCPSQHSPRKRSVGVVTELGSPDRCGGCVYQAACVAACVPSSCCAVLSVLLDMRGSPEAVS